MAAAEYYNPGVSVPQVKVHQAPRPQPYRVPNGSQQTVNALPYPISDAPPPYSAFPEQRPASQPPPQNRVHFQQSNYPPSPGPSYQPPPPPPQTGAYGYPPEKQQNGAGLRPPQQGQPSIWRPAPSPAPHAGSPGYPPQPRPVGQAGYPFPNGQIPQQQQPGYMNSQGRPTNTYLSPRDDLYSDDEDDYEGRSRSRGRRHHHHHHHTDGYARDRPNLGKKKGSGVSTFLGAGGGALIGDAIFPGLGTLGGAILGGMGGHKYEQQRRSYSHSNTGRRERRYSDNSREYHEDDYGRGGKY